MSSYDEYLFKLKTKLKGGDTTEHSYRPALQDFLEAQEKGISALNEPKRISCGAPDFKVSRKAVPLGYMETKDLGTNLDEIEKGKGPHGAQFIRYRDGLPNWVLTDYLEFRWFVNGKKRLKVRIAEIATKGRIVHLKDGELKLSELLNAFLNEPALTVASAKDLAVSMAQMTRIIRAQILDSLKVEGETWLHNWLSAFQETLIPNLNDDQFSDMFAQTIAYGLFAARIHLPKGEEFSRKTAAYNLPKTNPFLRKFFDGIAGVDLPDPIAWAVDDVVELLKHSDMAEILKDFGKGIGKEDPVVHFYETFLAAYDPKLREVRGVYYTPEPVVSYIVRSIDYLLKTRLNRPKGLADENTLILDPATGTATFLYVIIDQIWQKFAKQRGAWDGYVAEHLLNRIFGFELLMAPYAIAHLKLGMQLQETGYKFSSEQRLGIYLTNTLEEASIKSELLFAKWVSDEANAASAIKRDEPILIVLGNPPYSKASYNRGGWIEELMEDYKVTVRTEESQIQALSNDYIKFLRFAQWRIDRTGYGIVGFITGHGYLSGPQGRDLRASLLRSFDEIFIINLHGSIRRDDSVVQDVDDEPVFNIQQGTAIILAVKGVEKSKSVRYSEQIGSLENKFLFLRDHDVSTTDWVAIEPLPPYHFFTPSSGKSAGLRDEYEVYPSITDIFGTGNRSKDKENVWATGMASQQDDFAVSFDDAEVKRKIEDLLLSASEEELARKYGLCTTIQWNYERAKKELAAGTWRSRSFNYAYRPFDLRRSVFDRNVISILRAKVMRNLLKNSNIALVVSRVINDFSFAHAFIAKGPVDKIFISSKTSTNAYVFPLYIYPDTAGGLDLKADPFPNLSPSFLGLLSKSLGLPQEKPSGLPRGISPENILEYIYAILYSPRYRDRYEELLKIDFPHIPITRKVAAFRALAKRGNELMKLHLLEAPIVQTFITGFPKKGDNTVEKVRYADEANRVWINKAQYFTGVPSTAWEFCVGGYRVCEKWLKDRKGRALSYEDIQHYQKIVVALNETRRIMTEIDKAIPSWPIK